MRRAFGPLTVVFAMALPATAAPPERPARQAAREAAGYLGLSAEQHRRLNQINADFAAYLAEAAPRARRTPPAGRPALCEAAHQRQRQAQNDAVALLDAGQRDKLAQLEQALSLMPAIESAQATNLLAPRSAEPPAGMAQGQIEQQVRWVRVAAPALPGCPAMEETRRPGTVPAEDKNPPRGGPR